MAWSDHNIIFQAALYTSLCFRRMGYGRDHLYMNFTGSEAHVCIRAPGLPSFDVRIGELGMSEQDATVAWATIVRELGNGTITKSDLDTFGAVPVIRAGITQTITNMAIAGLPLRPRDQPT